MSIKKIGEKLKNKIPLSTEEEEEFIEFREAYSIVINLFLKELEKINFDEKYIIASRNKRIETIIKKLNRPERPKLDSIHDIAGTRIIFENIFSLNRFVDLLENSNLGAFKEKVSLDKDKYNYILRPKKDGYRSIHKVYIYSDEEKYLNKNNQYYKLYNKKIELQLRTKLQHIWATTLEVYDIINKSYLKLPDENKIDTDEGKFFKLASKIFEGIENNDTIQIKENIINIFTDNGLKKIFYKLKEVQKINKQDLPKNINDNDTFLLITFLKENKTTFFYAEDKKLLNVAYTRLEEVNDIIVLQVTSENLKELQKTYPNYFLDISEFIEIIEKYKIKYEVKEE